MAKRVPKWELQNQGPEYRPQVVHYKDTNIVAYGTEREGQASDEQKPLGPPKHVGGKAVEGATEFASED